MKLFKKLRWLLILPELGVTILIIYIFIKNRKIKIYSDKQWLLFVLICSLSMIFGVIVITVCLSVMNKIYHILDNINEQLLNALIVLTASYLITVPCYIFSKKFFIRFDIKSEEEKTSSD